MVEIEQRIEAEAVEPDYSGREFTADEIARGVHRRFVGGAWDDHGARQLDFLKRHGLLPEHKLLDVGCGCFRAGRHFMDYLDSGNYYGVDANHSLMQTGYDIELSAEQRVRLPIKNLRANDRFDVDFGTQFDFAIAQSVFTHVSLNHIRLCLYRVSSVVRSGGSFFATFFEAPSVTPVDQIFPPYNVKAFFTEKNLYWYYRTDLTWAAAIAPWQVNYIGSWGHPANQKMMQFIRLTDEEAVQRRNAAQDSHGSETSGRVVSLRRGAKRFARDGQRWLSQRLPTPRGQGRS